MTNSINKLDNVKLKKIPKIIVVVTNVILVLIAVISLDVYSKYTKKDQTHIEIEAFCTTIEVMKQISKNYLNTEKGYVEDWSEYIGSNDMTLEEALDQVVNNFNNIYPNVTITYTENTSRMLKEYMQNNEQVDIMMTTNDNLRYPKLTDMYIYDYCYDLSSENIDLSAIKDKMIENCEVDNHVVRIPIAENISGMVVNKSLLAKEGLNVPTNYKEFIDVLEKLKNKGYTPIQGAYSHAYNDLVINMAMTMIGNDSELLEKFNNLDPTAAQELKPVFEKLDYIISNGYTDNEVNESYHYDNYDKAILKFFEGDVPFWVCNTESVSGMKKRESKSQAFTDNPFEYEFMYVPLGENGVYKYIDSWYGFSVNKYSDNLDYAVEFMRFLATQEQINLMASVKGLPSVAKESSNPLYENIRNTTNIDTQYINNGKLKSYIRNYIENAAIKLGRGNCDGADGAVKALEQMILGE